MTGPTIRPTGIGVCTACQLILPLIACEIGGCSECYCEAHFVPHICRHRDDAMLFGLAEKAADAPVRLFDA